MPADRRTGGPRNADRRSRCCSRIARWDLIGPFEACPAFRFGGIPYAEAEASMRLFAKEVMPVFKFWT